MSPRELRLRQRIDQLLDRVERTRKQRDNAWAQAREERSQVLHLTRRVESLIKQRDEWKLRARQQHELRLAQERRTRQARSMH